MGGQGIRTTKEVEALTSFGLCILQYVSVSTPMMWTEDDGYKVPDWDYVEWLESRQVDPEQLAIEIEKDINQRMMDLVGDYMPEEISFVQIKQTIIQHQNKKR